MCDEITYSISNVALTVTSMIQLTAETLRRYLTDRWEMLQYFHIVVNTNKQYARYDKKNLKQVTEMGHSAVKYRGSSYANIKFVAANLGQRKEERQD